MLGRGLASAAEGCFQRKGIFIEQSRNSGVIYMQDPCSLPRCLGWLSHLKCFRHRATSAAIKACKEEQEVSGHSGSSSPEPSAQNCKPAMLCLQALKSNVSIFNLFMFGGQV